MAKIKVLITASASYVDGLLLEKKLDEVFKPVMLEIIREECKKNDVEFVRASGHVGYIPGEFCYTLSLEGVYKEKTKLI